MNTSVISCTAAVLGLLAGSLHAQSLPVPFSETAYRQDVKTLASDDFAGRGPLTAGEQKTLTYLQKRFKEIGLTPAGDEGYLQSVPLAKITADQDMQLTIGEQTFQPGDDFVARTERYSKQVKLDDSDVVFVGYGIHAPELGWDDYANVDVRGKTVVVLVNDPGFATQDPKLFRGTTMTYYGRWTYKYEEAMRQGAAGALIVHETAPAAYPWSVVENGAVGPKYALIDDNNNADKLGVMGWLQKSAATRLLKAAGFDYSKLKKAAAKPGFKAIDLHQKANLVLNNQLEKADSHNVVGMIEGDKYPDEAVVISAHWDHLGTNPNLPGKDKIFNGAVDNASGVAALLSLAREFKATDEKPQRSVVFVSFTGEESGLLGAQAFAAKPPVPTRNIAGILNMDAMNVSGKVDYALSFGSGMNELEKYLSDAAKAQGRNVKPDPKPESGYYFRSDHFALAQHGVPGLLFMSLGANNADYVAHHYHQVSDEYSPDWDLAGIKQDVGLIYSIAYRLADHHVWPDWYKGVQFKAIRDQQRSE